MCLYLTKDDVTRSCSHFVIGFGKKAIFYLTLPDRLTAGPCPKQRYSVLKASLERLNGNYSPSGIGKTKQQFTKEKNPNTLSSK